MVQIGQDTFARGNQSGYGSASDGQTWSQIDGTGTESIVSNEGQITGANNTNVTVLGSQTAAAIDVVVRTSVSATNARTGLVVRVQDANNYYFCRLNGSTNKVEIFKCIAGTNTSLATASFTVAASTFYQLRFRATSTTLEAKAWIDGTSEPGSWTVTTTDSAISAAGQFGLYSLTGATTTVVSYDHFTATNLTNLRDLSMRLLFANATSTRDLAMRLRYAGLGIRDLAMRMRFFAPTSTRDLAMRMRYAGSGVRDLSMRMNFEEAVIQLPAYAASQLSIQIGSYAPFSPYKDSFSLTEASDGRFTCMFTLVDNTGQLHFQWRLPIVVTHAVRGEIFRGFLNRPVEQNLYPNVTNTLQIAAIDEHWLPDKGAYEGDEFSNQNAGTIASFLASELAAEGVTTGYAIDYDTTQADFSEGTLSSVVAAANVGTTAIGDGDLELAPAGSNLSITEITQADFSTGTLASLRAYPASFGAQFLGLSQSADFLSLTSYYALKLSGSATLQGGGNLYSYVKIWAGSQAIAAGDALAYQLWISSTSPTFQAGVDFVCSDGTTLRDSPNGGTDSQGIPPHPNQDLSGLAKDTWYVRGAGMSLAGKTISYVTVAFEGDSVGAYTAYFRFIYLLDSNGNIKQTFFDGSTFSNGFQLQTYPAQQMQNSGYTNVQANVVIAFEKTGTRISPAYPLDSVGIARQSLMTWTPVVPKDTSGNAIAGHVLTVSASLDNGASWQPCTSGQPIPGLIAGFSTVGKQLMLSETITNNSPDPTQAILLQDVQASFVPSFQGTKTDIVTITVQPADWQAGTLSSGLFVTDGGLTLNGATRNWDDANESNQILYGSNGAFQFIKDKQFGLQSGNGADVRSRLDFAGLFGDFTAEVDINLSFADVAENAGIVYRCTGWQNANDTYAYSAFVNGSQIILAKGTNTSSGAGVFTQIASASLALSSGNVHRLKVTASGNSHLIYLDDVQYISATDSTYTAAGFIGLRYYNNAGSLILHTAITGGVAINSIVVNSIPVDIPNATQLFVDNGGAHPETVYTYGVASAATGNPSIQITTNSAGNGAAQANWTPTFSHSSSAVVVAPLSRSVIFDNFGASTVVSGIRTSPAIDLTSAGTLQDSFIGWNAATPAGSSAIVQTSVDNGTTWQTATNGAPIPQFINAQGAPLHGLTLTGVNLQTRVQLSTNSVTAIPLISGLSTWVIGQLHASGYRISPPLSLGPVGRVGSSLINWDATLPSDQTVLGVDVSPDGTNWTDVTLQKGQAIPFLESQDDPPYMDYFASDNSANYTASFGSMNSEAVAANWTVDTRNSRVIGVGGNSAFFSPNGIVLGDGEIIVDTDQCEQGGVIWCLSADFSTYYSLWIMDGSAARSPNRMKLFKVVNGARTQLGLGVVLNFPRGVPERFKIVQIAGAITVTVSFPVQQPDGSTVSNLTQTLSYTDPTPLQGGSVALRSSGGTQHYSQLRIMNYGQDVSQSTLYTRARLSTSDPLNTPQLQDLTVAVHSNTIGNGTLIPATTYSTLSGSQNTIAQDLDDLARQSGNYWWRILDGVLYFQSQTAQPAPWIATGADMLVASKITVSYANDLYRNQSIIIGGTDTQALVETRIADGFRTAFDTGSPVESITSILVNGQPVSFGLQGVDTGKQWYYQKGQKGISADPTLTPLPNLTQVSTTYLGQIQVIAKARNEGHIALLKSIDGTSGVVTVVEKADGLNSAAAQALAVSRINQYAVITVTIGFTTNRPGLHMGQLLTVYLPQHALNNQTFLITQVDYRPKQAIVNGQVSLLEAFTVQATSGPIVGSWLHLFS